MGSFMSNDKENKKLTSIPPHQKGDTFKFVDDPVSGKLMGFSINGTVIDKNNAANHTGLFEWLDSASKAISGSNDFQLTLRILQFLQYAMIGSDPDERMCALAEILPLLNPGDETETLLLGQFVCLQKAGLRCLGEGNISGNDIEFFQNQAIKLLRLANETMLTLLRYRNGGTQTVQVVHVNNANGQTIVAQNLSSGRGEGVNQNQGGSPCPHGNAGPRQEQMDISHADNQQWQTDAVGSMEEKARGRQKKDGKGSRR